VAAHQFDLIFSDVNMPVMDGKDFLINLRKKGHRTPFIFISAYSHLKEDLLRSELDVLDFIIKPFNKGIVEKIFFDFHAYLKKRSS
jgi:CheY-like chemotaxis protein